MPAIDLPDTLIELEHTAWTEIQSGGLTVPTALAVHQAIAAHVKATKEAGGEVSRMAVEEELKRRVRHPAPEPEPA